MLLCFYLSSFELLSVSSTVWSCPDPFPLIAGGPNSLFAPTVIESCSSYLVSFAMTVMLILEWKKKSGNPSVYSNPGPHQTSNQLNFHFLLKFHFQTFLLPKPKVTFVQKFGGTKPMINKNFEKWHHQIWTCFWARHRNTIPQENCNFLLTKYFKNVNWSSWSTECAAENLKPQIMLWGQHGDQPHTLALLISSKGRYSAYGTGCT